MTIGPYRVVSEYAHRSAGAERRTYRAVDRDTGAEVILKGRADEVSAALWREAFLLGRIRCPRVPRLIGMARHDHMVYAVLSHHADDTLKTVLDVQGGAAGWERAKPVALQLCEALASLHRSGTLHRDLHPGHISYRTRDDIQLFDFDLVLYEQRLRDGVWRNTHTDGTWETMAPEEFELGADLTPAANVYSAACLVALMVAGRYPLDYTLMVPNWQGRSDAEQKAAQFDLHRHRQPDLGRDLPLPLRSILAKALAKRADQRFATPDQLAAALATA